MRVVDKRGILDVSLYAKPLGEYPTYGIVRS